MFSIWSSLNSPLTDQNTIEETFKLLKQLLKLSFTGYFKPQTEGVKNENPKLKKNENELIKKFSNFLNLNEENCAENYLLYLNSPYNHFVISADLSEKLHVDELFSAHFQQFVDFYYRERYSFLKNLKLIISSSVDNSYLNYDQIKYQLPHLAKIKEIFSSEDLKAFFKSSLKDYGFLIKEIKSFATKRNMTFSNAENFQQITMIQLLRELELVLEIILILVNLIQIDSNTFQEILKEFNSHSFIKYLNSSPIQTLNHFSPLIDQISNLHTFILVKATRLDILTNLGLSQENNQISQEDKAKLVSADTKNQINDFIASFGSNLKASPLILAWATLLYNLSTDPELSKLFNNELKSLINRMFALSMKENVFMYLLELLASELFKSQDLVWHLKQIIYELLNSVLHSFDENSMGENLKTLYELCFFCMHKNEIICEHFWRLCQLPDRDNLTLLISYSLETFPISFGLTLTFFSQIASTSPELCKQTFEHLTRMDQFCEYFENISPDEYVSSVDSIRLVKNRKLFEGCVLQTGSKGAILSNLSNSNANSNIAHRMILQNQAISWNVTFNCLDLIQSYLNRINFAASQESLNLSSESSVISIIQLIDSLFKHFFDIDDLTEQTVYDMYTKYMEMFVNSCFTLFTNLITSECPDSYRLICKLFELLNNISPNVYDKIIRLLMQNKLIGHSNIYDKMSIQELFNDRTNLVKSSPKLLFLFRSQDYELIINYFKLIDNLIKANGNNIEYMSSICSMLVFVFPEIFKWRKEMLNLNIDMSLACLNLLHTVLNTSLSPSFTYPSVYQSSSNLHTNCVVTIDQFCETVLLNTECTQSLLNLIYTAYESSQDSNNLDELKKIDNILMQSISLINRLIVVPKSNSSDPKAQSINQSILYSLLIKSISQQAQSGDSSTYLNEDLKSSNEIINKNNQFLLQLNLMMSQTNPSLSKNLTVLNTTTITDNKTDLNWFHLLTKIAIYKSNHILDCLLFSIFKKISQLTPRLFGSLLGPYTPQMHSIILNKLKPKNDGQIISTISEFICSLIENQPGFFQTLANLRIEPSQAEAGNEKFIEGDKSVLKALFDLLNELDAKKNRINQDYFVSISGILSIFYTIWSNKKLDFMNYCKQKKEFWKILSSSLNIIKKDLRKRDLENKNSPAKNELTEGDDVTSEYSEFFGQDNWTQFNHEFSRFDQFILESNIKSVSYVFKIVSIELFELIYIKKLSVDSSDLEKLFSENIFDKNLIEKWLDFYSFQLKKDLNDETQNIIDRLERAIEKDDQQTLFKTNISILDPNTLKSTEDKLTSASSSENEKKQKSKILFDSIQMLLLLINKTTRLVNLSCPVPTGKPSSTTPSSNTKLNIFVEKLSMKRIKLEYILDSFLGAMHDIIEHFSKLQQEQQLIQQRQEQLATKADAFFLTQKINNKPIVQSVSNRFVTLKQSNEIVKQFHSISNTLMVLITSLKTTEQITTLNPKLLIKSLVDTMEKLVNDDFNYFPVIINSIQTSLLHIFGLNSTNSVEILNSNEPILKRLILICCKIFTISTNNLEDESFTNSSSFKDCLNTFILNNNLIKFLMSNFDEKYWNDDLIECCMIQCLYALFEKYVQNANTADLMYSILEMFFAFANYQIEHLAKSDFNTRTCLLAGKIFEFSSILPESPSKKAKLDLRKSSIKWSDVLRVYMNIQTILLTKLKYKYLKDSILFFGSYFETMVHIALNMHQSLDISLLEITNSFARYLSQMSNYTKELLIHIPNSMENMARLSCSLIQICIMKLSQVKMISIKTQHGSQQFNNPLFRISSEDLLHIQNLLFSITTFSLDSIFNFIPNFSDPNYLAKLDEYKILLAFQLTPPSSFDSHSALSFGSLLWLIDYILKILHRYDQASSIGNTTISSTVPSKTTGLNTTTQTPNKLLQEIKNNQASNLSAVNTSPKKNVTIVSDETSPETKLPTKSLIVCVLEKTLNLLLTQIILCDRQIQFSSRDKKLFKRELNSEINSIVHGLGKTIKKTTQSTSQYPSKSPTAGSSANVSSANLQLASNLISTGSKQIYEFFKCIQFILEQNINAN